MIRIGIVEDDDGDRRLIKIALDQCSPDEIEFIDYEIQNTDDFDLETKILQEIEKDILNERIQGLIIDQNMRTKIGSVSGSNIYKNLIKHIREFPLIILTNYRNVAANEKMVDSDKIYEKENFITPENEESKKNVKSFLRNIKRFLEIRVKLENDLEELQEEYKKGTIDEKSLNSMISIENELSNYKIGEKFIAEKQLSNIDFNDIMQVIDKVEGLLNGK